jgi:hypothetical protein
VIAAAVLAELRRRGVLVEARGEMLHVEAPRGTISPEILRRLRQLKPELLRLVAMAPAPPTVGDGLGGVSAVQPSLLVAEICAMALADFARAGLVVEVWSKLLGEAVVFGSDDARIDPGERRPVYRARELQVLLGLTAPTELRRVHEVKKIFRGTITDASPNGARTLS